MSAARKRVGTWPHDAATECTPECWEVGCPLRLIDPRLLRLSRLLDSAPPVGTPEDDAWLFADAWLDAALAVVDQLTAAVSVGAIR